jgi:type IV pilus assembly protein PilY1
MTKSNTSPLRPLLGGLRHAGIAALLTVIMGGASAQTVSQSPLSVASNVPGNLVLVPSVEWPTLDSMANLGAYTLTRSYAGYFDPD